MATVILGAGIIGLSTAYYLSSSPAQSSDSIHIVDPSPRLFASASGNAAGFLAKDWFSKAVAPLGSLSFALHKELAEQHEGRRRWGYSRSTGTSIVNSAKDKANGSARGEDWLFEGTSRAGLATNREVVQGDAPPWLTMTPGLRLEVISDGDSTAQVRGVQIHQPARALSISKDLKNELSSVRLLEGDDVETDIPCTKLVIAAGAWTPQVFSTIFSESPLELPISPLAGHSLVVRSPRWPETQEDTTCHAVFATDPSGFSPEIFSRAGGEIYVAGLNSSRIPLPEVATEAKVDAEAIAQLCRVSTKLLGIPESQDDLVVLRQGLCFRPVTRDGQPTIGRIEDSRLGDGISTRGGGDGGVFVSAGHGPWGISLSLGSGKVLAELVEGKGTSADVEALGP
ncbi:MAG: hypothetical protein M1825_000773 [Sarcosagium campestre]|nr:MAG: hypothetical protein M1825_000773 [Sarcosagium campestre]